MMNKNALGLTLGFFAAIIHAVWVILVGVGIGQNIINLIFPLHFLNVVYQVTTFNVTTAILLVVMAFIGGFVMGWIFAALWNEMSRRFK